MRHGSLFSGIGGFDLAASWMGWENVFQVEWDAWCQRVLAKNFPDTLKFGDIKEFNDKLENGEIITDTECGGFYSTKSASRSYKCRNGQAITEGKGWSETICTTKNFGRIDILSGGFPCQPFSHAGKRNGVADERYLWPEMLRTIRILKPSYVVGENVAGLVSMENGKTLDTILSDLENEGYATEQVIIPACAVGAWHRRDRIWIIAHNNNARNRASRSGTNGNRKAQGKQWEQSQSEFSGYCENVSYAIGQRGCGRDTGGEYAEDVRQQSRGEEHGYWHSEPSVGGGFNGLPLWLHRHTIKGYGTEESYRRIEILRELWKTISTQILWQVIGGFDQVQKSEILFSIVCEYEKRPNETRLFLESKETLERFVRSLWMQGEITGSSFRSEKGEQYSGEHSDSLQTLSRLLAHDLQENWQISCWEDGIPRVSTGIKNRVNRLKGLGNAIVPQVAFEIFKAIEQLESTLIEKT